MLDLALLFWPHGLLGIMPVASQSLPNPSMSLSSRRSGELEQPVGPSSSGYFLEQQGVIGPVWPFGTRLYIVVAPKTERPWKMAPVLPGETWGCDKPLPLFASVSLPVSVGNNNCGGA